MLLGRLRGWVRPGRPPGGSWRRSSPGRARRHLPARQRSAGNPARVVTRTTQNQRDECVCCDDRLFTSVSGEPGPDEQVAERKRVGGRLSNPEPPVVQALLRLEFGRGIVFITP